jgi:hypothetical protein
MLVPPQADVLEAVVELFWVRHAGGDGEAESYSRPEPKKTLMLHYIFVTALLLEGWQMAPAQVRALCLRPWSVILAWIIQDARWVRQTCHFACCEVVRQGMAATIASCRAAVGAIDYVTPLLIRVALQPINHSISHGPTLQYEALRSQLGMRSEDVVRRLRELGATATPIKSTPGAGRCRQSRRSCFVCALDVTHRCISAPKSRTTCCSQ